VTTFKLDENLGPSILEAFTARGLDCRTTREEGLGGAKDPTVLEAAIAEGRVLVTLDHDFGNVVRYPPGGTAGVAVLNPPGRASRRLLRSMVEQFLGVLQRDGIHGRLWIVEAARIREHDAGEEGDGMTPGT
jgi:predicted nuclease of predicted toxin-antitoxin system